MAELDESYRHLGCRSVAESRALAELMGDRSAVTHFSRLMESGRENSIAMAVVPGVPPGRNVCSFLRSLTHERSRLVVVALDPSGAPGAFERMLRASLPDCERKVRVVEAAGSIADAIGSAEKNRHYRPSQALELFCDAAGAQSLRRDIAAGRLDLDPTVISIRQVDIPSDDVDAISQAVSSDDQAALHRVLDPHLFSDAAALATYRSALVGESLVREFLSDVAPSRELAIRHLDDLLARAMGDDFHDLEYLGSGRNGSAYRSPDGLIIKVTTDPVEAQAAARLAGHSTDHLGEIYAIFPMAANVWLVLQEELADLPEDDRMAADLAAEALDGVGGLDLLNRGDLDALVDSIGLLPDLEVAEFVVETLRRLDVAGMCYELSMFGLTGDFHGGNVRMRDGRPVLVDLGTPGDDTGMVQEYGTGSPGSGANGQATMRGANSSSWSSGKGALKQPQSHVPEDENESERDRALDWGPGRIAGSSF